MALENGGFRAPPAECPRDPLHAPAVIAASLNCQGRVSSVAKKRCRHRQGPIGAESGSPKHSIVIDLRVAECFPIEDMASETKRIPVESIRPNRNQPRTVFATGAIRKLADTIREHGLLQPLVVRRVRGASGYELVAGERRLRAVKLLGRKTVPAIIRIATDRDAAELALIENLMREGLDPVEEGRAFRALLNEGESYRRLAKRIGKAVGYIQNRVRLLDMPADVRMLVRRRPHMLMHGYELSRIKDTGIRKALVKKCLGDSTGGLTLSRLRYEIRFAAQESGREETDHPYALWECDYRRDPSDGDETYPGNCHPLVVQKCLECISRNTLHRSKPTFTFWLPFAGSGTGIETAKRLGVRKIVATDVTPAAPGVERADARQSGLRSASIDCIFAHPPYWSAFRYSRARRGETNRADMSLLLTLDEYLLAIEQFYREAYRVMRPDGHLFLMIGDIRRGNELVPLVAHLSLLGQRYFRLTQRVTVIRNRASPLTPLLVSNARRRGHLIDVTDSVIFFHKPR